MSSSTFVVDVVDTQSTQVIPAYPGPVLIVNTGSFPIYIGNNPDVAVLSGAWAMANGDSVVWNMEQPLWAISDGGSSTISVTPNVTIGPISGGGGGVSVTSVNGQTGVVVLDAADVGAVPLSDYAGTKGDLLLSDGTDPLILSVGTNGQVLAADSASPGGAHWIDVNGAVISVNGSTGVVVLTASSVAAIPTAIGTAKGDVIGFTGSNTPVRLAVGTDGQVLTAASGQATGLQWVTPAADAVTSVNGQTGVVVLSASDVGAPALSTLTAKGSIYVATASGTVTELAVGTNGQQLQADSSQPTGVKWAADASAPVTSVNGQTGVVVLTAADVGAIGTDIGTAKGDLIAFSASDAPTNLAVGTNGQVLTANSGQPTGVQWVTPAATTPGDWSVAGNLFMATTAPDTNLSTGWISLKGTVAPTGDPGSNNGYFGVDVATGNLVFRGSAGTITQLAPA